MRRLRLARAAAWALIVVAAGCGAGEVTVEAVLPAGVGDDDLRRVVAFKVVATETGSGEVRETSAGSVGPLSIVDLPDGRWTFRLEASDEGGRVLLQAKAGPVDVTRRGTAAVRALLAPVEAFSRLPVEGPAAEAIAALSGLSATTVTDGAGRSLVLIAGGDDGAGPSRQAWVYDPASLGFGPVGDLRCSRAGHAAAAVTRADGRGAVLVAGGGGARCVAGGATAATTLELFDPDRRAFEVVQPAWSEPPDLSAAVLAPAGPGRAVLAAGDETWLIDVDAPWAAQELFAWEEPGSGGSAATVTSSGRGAVVTGGNVFVFDDQGNPCAAFDAPALVTPVTGAFGLTRDDWLLVTGEARWEMLRFSRECTLADERFAGELSAAGPGRVAAPLADGRILFVGGEAGQAELILPPCSRTTAPLSRPGPESEHTGPGLAVAALPDGSALVVGGGAQAELFNPWRWGWKSSPDDTCEWPEQAGAFGPGARSDDGERFRLLVVADATPAAEDLRGEVGLLVDRLVPGAWLEAEQSRGTDFDVWAGVLAATGLITRFEVEAGCDGASFPRWAVHVTPDDLIHLGNDEGELESGMNVELANRIQLLGQAVECPVRQPLSVAQHLAAQLADEEGGDLADALVPRGEGAIPPGAILVALLAAGDDCSNDPEYPGTELEPFDAATCADETEGMLAPEQVAERVIQAAEALEPAGIALGVVVVHRAPTGRGCELPPRLARFVAALGPRGHAVAACQTAPLEDEIPLVSNVASFLKYRVVCAPFAGGAARDRCAVAVRWRDAAGDVERLATPGPWTLDADEAACQSVLRISAAFTGDDVEGFEATSFEQFQALCW